MKTTAGQTLELTVPQKVAQPHGGALNGGGTPGNAGGTGRPPSELRARLRGSFEERVRVLEAIADNPGAAAGDRIRAVDVLARYGLGTTQELSVEVVRQKLAAPADLLREHVPPSLYAAFEPDLRAIWNAP